VFHASVTWSSQRDNTSNQFKVEPEKNWRGLNFRIIIILSLFLCFLEHLLANILHTQKNHEIKLSTDMLNGYHL
jgi:hypothetical protein